MVRNPGNNLSFFLCKLWQENFKIVQILLAQSNNLHGGLIRQAECIESKMSEIAFERYQTAVEVGRQYIGKSFGRIAKPIAGKTEFFGNDVRCLAQFSQITP